jgi:hypothetical protein
MAHVSHFRPGRSILVFAIGVLALVCAVAILMPATGQARPADAQAPGTYKLYTAPAVRHDASPPLRDLHAPPAQHTLSPQQRRQVGRPAAAHSRVAAPILPGAASSPAMPTPSINFEGMSVGDNPFPLEPPDTEGDVGPNNYVQWVNIVLSIYDKAGHRLLGPVPGNTPWAGFGGPCEFDNDGDPIVLYDPLADRWVLTQLALPYYPYGPFYQCFAVSQTPDPTAGYYRYEFLISNTLLNDYPKFGVWPDAYYGSFNLFDAFGYDIGAGAAAFDRAQMLSGQQAYFQMYILPDEGTLLPADLDGATPPPPGAPGVFTSLADSALHFFTLHVDWDHHRSTLVGPTIVGTDPFNPLCPDLYSYACIPQPNTTDRLDGLGDRLMYRAAYRNFGDHESLLLTHAVDLGTSDVHAGLRWYEIRNPVANPTIYQQGTYAPDADNRWLGSIAMDQAGDIALGYSVSSSTVYPSIRYTGRLPSDPPGTLPQGEALVIAGSGSEVGYGEDRWGDYSMMAVDPSDDCTFWYTQEYVQTTGPSNWQTRFAAFRFPSCVGSTPTPTVTGTPPTPTPTVTSQPSPSPTRTPPPSPTYPPIPTDTPCAVRFTDVHPADYFYQAVEYLACHYIISGYGDGTFRPYNYTTRAQFVKIIVAGDQLAARAPTGGYSFADVPPSDPFYYYIEQAAYYNLVNGYTCGGPNEPCDDQNRPYFRPYAEVTRAQVAKILARATNWPPITPPTATFADVPPGSPFYSVIETAVCNGLISGYTCGGPNEPCDAQQRPYFRPLTNAIRGQIAKIIYLTYTNTAVCGLTTPTAIP